jgi:hypothetical protein
MNHKLGKLRGWTLLAVAVGLLGTAPPTFAQQNFLVNWGGDYVSNTQDLQGKNSASNSTQAGRDFSASTPMNPTSGYSGTSAAFYGGAVMSQTAHAPVGWSIFAVENQGPTDQIHLRVQDNDPLNMHYVMYWDKADFLAPWNAQPVQFTTLSRFDLTIHNNNSHMEDAVGRWLVRDGSTFYLSEATFQFPQGNGTVTPSLTFASDTDDGNWAVYSPSGLNIDFNGTSFTAQNFADVTAVGFYVEHDDRTHNNLDWHVSGFSMATVPEPTSAALLALGGGLLAGRSWYARRRPRQE